MSELVTPAAEPILSVDHVRDKVLRAVNGSVEDLHIENLILAATNMAEDATQRALQPQTWRMVLSGFPWGHLVLERPPLIEITSFGYLDGDGVEQTLAVSPAEYETVTGFYRKARVKPLYGASWPTAQAVQHAVTIEYRAGYASMETPPMSMILRGIEMAVLEMYGIRGLSVQGVNTSVPSQLQLERYWRPVVG